MAGPITDELTESDPLLTFAEEPSENRAEIKPVAEPVEPRRLDLIEQTIDQTHRDLAQIRSEIATLVGAVEDMKKRSARRTGPAPTTQPEKPWARATAATVGVMFGIMIGGLIWMQLGGARPLPVGAVPQEQQPAATPPADSGPRPDAVPVTPEPPAPKPRDQQSAVTPAPAARPEPVSYVGTLSIEAVPIGEVFLNRQDAGRTPLRLEKLRAGSHLIWIEREGYQRWTRVVEVRADQNTRLSAELEPLAR